MHFPHGNYFPDLTHLFDSRTVTRSRLEAPSRIIERSSHRARSCSHGSERGGLYLGLETRTSTRAQISTGSDLRRNTEDQSQVNPSPTTLTATPTATDTATLPVTENAASSGDGPRSASSVEQVQTDVTDASTERDTLIGNVNEYKGG